MREGGGRGDAGKRDTFFFFLRPTLLHSNTRSSLAAASSPLRHNDVTGGKHRCQTSLFSPYLAPDGSIENTCVLTVCLLRAPGLDGLANDCKTPAPKIKQTVARAQS